MIPHILKEKFVSDYDEINQFLKKKEIEYQKYLQEKFSFNKCNIATTHEVDFNSDIVKIGSQEEITEEQRVCLEKELKQFIPWRKGPWSIFGIDIDAEWRSDFKWNRLQSFLPNLKDKIICDIGCNNGYYLYKMLPHEPKLIWGIDPTMKYKATFDYINQFVSEEKYSTEQGVYPSRIHYNLIGYEVLTHIKKAFDVIFCMGILYHHSDPVSLLKTIKESLAPKGQVIIESMGIAGEESIALFPGKTYGNAKGFWYLPTKKCLENWLIKAGYRNIECHYNEYLQEDEQRKTDWSPYDSFAESLDSNDKTKTVDGHPRQKRFYFIATK